MSRVQVGILAVILATLSMTVGCVSKKEFNALEQDYRALLAQKQQLQDELDKSTTGQDELSSQLLAKDDELMVIRAELASANRKLASAPPPPLPALPTEGWEATTIGDRVTVGSDILFAAGSATLTSGGKAALARIVKDLKGPYAGLAVRVYGFTDTDPIKATKKLWKDNLDLSANRAMAVTRYLRSNQIKANAIETIAMGSVHPVATNSTKAGKKSNRRVEIIVIK